MSNTDRPIGFDSLDKALQAIEEHERAVRDRACTVRSKQQHVEGKLAPSGPPPLSPHVRAIISETGSTLSPADRLQFEEIVATELREARHCSAAWVQHVAGKALAKVVGSPAP